MLRGVNRASISVHRIDSTRFIWFKTEFTLRKHDLTDYYLSCGDLNGLKILFTIINRLYMRQTINNCKKQYSIYRNINWTLGNGRWLFYFTNFDTANIYFEYCWYQRYRWSWKDKTLINIWVSIYSNIIVHICINETLLFIIDSTTKHDKRRINRAKKNLFIKSIHTVKPVQNLSIILLIAILPNQSHTSSL